MTDFVTCQDAIAYLEAMDEDCDVLITDPPYSARTHGGQVTSRYTKTAHGLKDIEYDAIDEDRVSVLAKTFCARTRGWIAVFCDDSLIPAWRKALADGGRRYAFAPVPCVGMGSRPRLGGDGPCSWTDYLMVSRPRNRVFARWGTLPGAYVFTRSTKNDARGVQGGKPIGLMSWIVRDYTRPGDLIIDPHAGGGTTLVASIMAGRRAAGCEIDPGRAAMSEAWCQDVASQERWLNDGEQRSIFDHDENKVTEGELE